jgi:HK97 family phage prohead protease
MQSKTQSKEIVAQITKSAASDGTFVLSSSSFDRDQDRILPEALKAAVKSSPQLMCLWQHKADQPIGVWKSVRMQGEKMIGDLKIASTNLGQMVKTLLDEDVPLAASIGFMGGGDFNDKGGIDFKAIELFECSVVSVPANRDAVRIAKQFGYDVQSSDVITIGAKSCPSVEVALKDAKRAIARVNLMRRT